MTVSHRDSPEPTTPAVSAEKTGKVARMACCCKLSDLLPIVRQRLEAKQAAQPRREAEAA